MSGICWQELSIASAPSPITSVLSQRLAAKASNSHRRAALPISRKRLYRNSLIGNNNSCPVQSHGPCRSERSIRKSAPDGDQFVPQPDPEPGDARIVLANLPTRLDANVRNVGTAMPLGEHCMCSARKRLTRSTRPCVRTRTVPPVSGQTGVAVSVEPRSELLRSYPALGLQGFLSRGIKPPDTHPFLAVSSSTTQHPH